MVKAARILVAAADPDKRDSSFAAIGAGDDIPDDSSPPAFGVLF